MEFNSLPQVNKKNQQKLMLYLTGGTISERDEKIEKLLKNKKEYVPKDFSDYMKTICLKNYRNVGIFGGIILGAIGAIILGILFKAEMEYWYIASLLYLIPMVLASMACLLLGPRVVFGGFLAVVLSPILYPVYLLICDIQNNRIRVANLPIELEVKNIEETCSQELDRIREYFNQSISDYKKEYEKELKLQIEKLKESSVANEIAEWLAVHFIKKIEVADRSSYVKEVAVSWEISVSPNKVICSAGEYIFEKHRYPDLENFLMQNALARVLEMNIKKYILENCGKDGSENICDIKFDKNLKEIEESHKDTPMYVSKALYQELNANYKELQSW